MADDATTTARKAQGKAAFEAAREYLRLQARAGCHDTAVHIAKIEEIAPGIKNPSYFVQNWMKKFTTAKPQEIRSFEEWKEFFPPYPLAEDNFCVSFEPNQPELYVPALKKYGLVVIRVLSEEQCDATIAGMFEDINDMMPPSASKQCDVSPQQPESWETCNFPTRGKFLTSQPAFHPVAFANRLNPTIFRVFSHIFGGETRLHCSIDNWGVVRGTRAHLARSSSSSDEAEAKAAAEAGAGAEAETKARADTKAGAAEAATAEAEAVAAAGVEAEATPGADEGVVGERDWPSELKPHWDYNPWRFVAQEAQGLDAGYQGLIALTNQTRETGVHRTLPGGTPYLKQWCAETTPPKKLAPPLLADRSHRPKQRDPCVAHMQDIPLRRGELLVWSWGQLHGCTQNHSSRMRLHQFIRLYPCPEVHQTYTDHDRYGPAAVREAFADNLHLRAAMATLDDRGKRLFGLLPYGGAAPEGEVEEGAGEEEGEGKCRSDDA